MSFKNEFFIFYYNFFLFSIINQYLKFYEVFCAYILALNSFFYKILLNLFLQIYFSIFKYFHLFKHLNLFLNHLLKLNF